MRVKSALLFHVAQRLFCLSDESSQDRTLFSEFGLSQIVANFAEESSEIETIDHAKWKRGTAMPDGSRKRRHSANCAKKQWYAHHRAIRFSRRFLGVAAA